MALRASGYTWRAARRCGLLTGGGYCRRGAARALGGVRGRERPGKGQMQLASATGPALASAALLDCIGMARWVRQRALGGSDANTVASLARFLRCPALPCSRALRSSHWLEHQRGAGRPVRSARWPGARSLPDSMPCAQGLRQVRAEQQRPRATSLAAGGAVGSARRLAQAGRLARFMGVAVVRQPQLAAAAAEKGACCVRTAAAHRRRIAAALVPTGHAAAADWRAESRPSAAPCCPERAGG